MILRRLVSWFYVGVIHGFYYINISMGRAQFTHTETQYHRDQQDRRVAR